MNATETKLVSLLYQKNDYHPMVRNEIDLLVKDFINRIETTIELYATKCKPIIEDKLPIPVLVQQKSDQLLASDDGDDDDDDTRMVLTPAIYAKEMRNITKNLLKEELEHKYLDSDDRGDTEEEVENLLRLYPEGLDLKATGGLRILRCRNVKSLLFVPIILKLKKELGCDSMRHDDNADEQFVIDRLFTRLKVPLESTSMIELYDERCALVLQKIHAMGLITTRDIVSNTYGDSTRYFEEIFRGKKYFCKHRFLFLSKCMLTQFKPQQQQIISILLQRAAGHPTMDAFRCVFATALSLYPNKVGINLLHRKSAMGKSPYMIVCAKHGKKATDDVIRETLQSYNATPYDPVDAFVYAATENKIRLDGVYSLLRTHPDILQLLLSSDTTTTSAATTTATCSTEGSTTASFSLPESKKKYRKRKR